MNAETEPPAATGGQEMAEWPAPALTLRYIASNSSGKTRGCPTAYRRRFCSYSRSEYLDRGFVQFSAAIHGLDVEGASSAADRAVDGMASDAALDCERKVRVEMAVHAFEI